MGSKFDSFNASPADAFIESAGFARGGEELGELYIGGQFTAVDGDTSIKKLAAWNSKTQTFSQPGGVSPNNTVNGLATIIDPADGVEKLALGGTFTNIGTRISLYNRETDSFEDPFGTGGNDDSLAFINFNGNLIVGGAFTSMNGGAHFKIAEWDGVSFSSLGGGLDITVNALAIFGGDLIAGGRFQQEVGTGKFLRKVGRWDGTTWHKMDEGLSGTVEDLRVFGGQLIATGDSLSNVAGGTGTSGCNAAVWTGTEWNGLGGSALSAICGTDSGYDNDSRNSTIYQGGLAVGGRYAMAGGVSASKISVFNGGFSPLGTGITGSLFVNDVQSNGSDLYATGDFNMAGGVSVNRIAVWNGSEWAALNNGLNAFGTVLEIYGEI